jgi:hypothetical protein
MFGYFYEHIYLKITAKPQIPFLKEMVFVNELFFWLKKKVKKKPQNGVKFNTPGSAPKWEFPPLKKGG